MLKAFLNDQSGVNSMEYGFIAGLVSLAILPTLVILGVSLETGYASVNDQMLAAIGQPPAD